MTLPEVVQITVLILVTAALSHWLSRATGLSLWLTVPIAIVIVLVVCSILTFIITRTVAVRRNRRSARDQTDDDS